jgi:hypothetical protein
VSDENAAEPLPDESLSSYVRRAARRQFFADPIAFMRAGGVEWHDRSRDPDLLSGPLLEQLTGFLGLELDRLATLTIHSHLRHLPDADRGSMRWWATLSPRTRMCDRCVDERPYGRVAWRLPVITECLTHRRPLLDECRLCGAVRDRSSRRWERFDCGHHVRRSAGADSLRVDLRLQQAIQASLGIGRKHPPRPDVWLIHAALSQRRRLVEVQSARQSLRQLWVEHRRARAVWHGPAQALPILEQRGQRMYPSQREPAAAAGLPELAASSLADLRDIAARYGLLIREQCLVAPDGPVAVTNPALGQTVAL